MIAATAIPHRASPAISPDAVSTPAFSTRAFWASFRLRLSRKRSVTQRITPPTKMANVVPSGRYIPTENNITLFTMIMIEVKSVMLFSVGMYLPLGTTFAIFVGGVIRWVTDRLRDKRNLNDAQKARVENAGVLTASGLIAGEALCGIAVAAIIAKKLAQNAHAEPRLYQFAIGDHLIMAVIALAILVAAMIMVPLANAGRPEDPAPPTAIM